MSLPAYNDKLVKFDVGQTRRRTCENLARARKSSGAEAIPMRTYELYHDMYSPILFSWREKQRRWLFGWSLLAVFLLTSSLYYLVIHPYLQLETMAHTLSHPVLGDQQEYQDVDNLRQELRRSIFVLFGRPTMTWDGYSAKLEALAALRHDNEAYIHVELNRHKGHFKDGEINNIPEFSTLHETLRVSIPYLADVYCLRTTKTTSMNSLAPMGDTTFAIGRIKKAGPIRNLTHPAHSELWIQSSMGKDLVLVTMARSRS